MWDWRYQCRGSQPRDLISPWQCSRGQRTGGVNGPAFCKLAWVEGSPGEGRYSRPGFPGTSPGQADSKGQASSEAQVSVIFSKHPADCCDQARLSSSDGSREKVVSYRYGLSRGQARGGEQVPRLLTDGPIVMEKAQNCRPRTPGTFQLTVHELTCNLRCFGFLWVCFIMSLIFAKEGSMRLWAEHGTWGVRRHECIIESPYLHPSNLSKEGMVLPALHNSRDA